jgi:hypothetical protein
MNVRFVFRALLCVVVFHWNTTSPLSLTSLGYGLRGLGVYMMSRAMANSGVSKSDLLADLQKGADAKLAFKVPVKGIAEKNLQLIINNYLQKALLVDTHNRRLVQGKTGGDQKISAEDYTSYENCFAVGSKLYHIWSFFEMLPDVVELIPMVTYEYVKDSQDNVLDMSDFDMEITDLEQRSGRLKDVFHNSSDFRSISDSTSALNVTTKVRPDVAAITKGMIYFCLGYYGASLSQDVSNFLVGLLAKAPIFWGLGGSKGKVLWHEKTDFINLVRTLISFDLTIIVRANLDEAVYKGMILEDEFCSMMYKMGTKFAFAKPGFESIRRAL